MITTKRGNILDAKSGIIVHGCNSRGAMGSGVALAIRSRYPMAYNTYKKADRYMGSISLCKVADGLYVANGITQKDFGKTGERFVSYTAIKGVFEAVVAACAELDIWEIHFPLIGAGLGGGDWAIIQNIIEETVPDEISKTLWIL